MVAFTFFTFFQCVERNKPIATTPDKFLALTCSLVKNNTWEHRLRKVLNQVLSGTFHFLHNWPARILPITLVG
jgi:hypothetical protein